MVTLKIEKRHLYALSLTLGIVIGVLVVNAVTPAFSSTRPWHPLQQVSITSDGSASVDSNHDGVIDNAERLGGLSPGAYQKDVFGSCADGQYVKTVADNGGVTCGATLLTGFYNGNGASSRSVTVSGVSSTNAPRAIEIFGRNGVSYFKSSSVPDNECFFRSPSGASSFIDNCITFTSGGFSVGLTSGGPNVAGVTYYYVLWQ